jgi:hypothetical protein
LPPTDPDEIRPSRSAEDLYRHVLDRTAALRQRRRRITQAAVATVAVLVLAAGSTAALTGRGQHRSVLHVGGGGGATTEPPATIAATSTSTSTPLPTTTTLHRASAVTVTTMTAPSTTASTMKGACAGSDLAYATSTDRSSYPPQTTVSIILSERNRSASPCTVVTPGCGYREMHVQVFAADGTKVWDNGPPPSPPGIPESCNVSLVRTLRPGETYTFPPLPWDQRNCPTPSSSPCSGGQVSPGQYTVRWYGPDDTSTEGAATQFQIT